jgi:hypothetical protein
MYILVQLFNIFEKPNTISENKDNKNPKFHKIELLILL